VGYYYVVVMGYIQRLERVMIKSTANSNVKSTPSTPIRAGGVVGETPTHNLPQFLGFGLILDKETPKNAFDFVDLIARKRWRCYF